MNVVTLEKLKIFFRIRNLVILALVSLVILIGTLIWKFNVFESVDRIVNQAIYRVSPKSIARISLDQESSSQSAKIRVDFEVLANDQSSFDELAKRLKIGESWPKEISIGITEEAKIWLKGLLPLDVSLRLKTNELTFGNVTLNSLISAQERSEYQFASGSGEVKLRMSSASDIDLSINDLASVINEASKSGELYVSPNLSKMDGLIEQIESIGLRVAGKRVTGRILFHP